MREYSKQQLRKMWDANRLGQLPFQPFRGKFPVHILVMVGVNNPRTGRAVKRFFYQGKYSIAALKQAHRTFEALLRETGERPFSQYIEYTTNATLIWGSLHQANCTKWHPLVHTTSYYRQGHATTAFNMDRISLEVPVRCGKFTMLVRERELPGKDDTKGWLTLYDKMRFNRRIVQGL